MGEHHVITQLDHMIKLQGDDDHALVKEMADDHDIVATNVTVK